MLPPVLEGRLVPIVTPAVIHQKVPTGSYGSAWLVEPLLIREASSSKMLVTACETSVKSPRNVGQFRGGCVSVWAIRLLKIREIGVKIPQNLSGDLKRGGLRAGGVVVGYLTKFSPWWEVTEITNLILFIFMTPLSPVIVFFLFSSYYSFWHILYSLWLYV